MYVRGHFYASRAYFRKGNLEKTMFHSLEALKNVNRQEDSEIFAKISNMMGVLNSMDQNELLALDYFLDGLEVAKKFQLESCVSNFLINIGCLYQNLNQHEKAISYFVEAENISAESMAVEDYTRKQIHVYLNLAISYLHMERYHSAEKYIGMVLKNQKGYQGENIYFISRCVWCRINLRLGVRDMVSKYLIELIHLFTDPLQEIDYVKDTGEFYLLLKEMEEYDYLKQVILLFDGYVKTQNVKALLMQGLEMRIDYYTVCGEKDKYQEACMEYFELNRQLIDERYEKRVKALDTKFILKKREQMAVESEKTKAQLKRKSEEDPLTHMANRFRLEKSFISIINDNTMREYLLTVGIIDVDFFKQYNDCYGHVKGDECLRKVAEVIASYTDKKHGICARYGGDEFVLVLPKISRMEVEELADGIMKGIRMLKIAHEKSNTSPVVTVSQGYYVSRTESDRKLEDYIENADKSLYFVKNEERDSFCISYHAGL